MTDSASLGRAVLAIDVDRSAFDAELQRIRQEVERFAPNFGGVDQVLQGVARSVNQLERALQGAGQEVNQLGRAAQQAGVQQQQGFEVAGRAAQRYLTGLNGLTAQLQRLQRTPINLDSTARGIKSLGEAFNDARTAANEFVTGLINGTQRLDNTTAAVTQQANALRTLAANTDTASASYRNFVNAEEIARQRLTGRLEFDRLDAVRNAFEVGNVGRRRGGDISRTSQFNGIQELLAQAENISAIGGVAGRLGARSGNTPLTPAILQNVIGQLEYARQNTRLSNPDLNRLTTQIERLTTLLNRTLQPLQPGQSVLPPQQLLLPPGDTTRAQFRGGAVPINRFATPADYDRLAAQEARAARLAGRIADQQAYYSPSRTSGVRETPAELQSMIDALTRLRASLGETNPQFRVLTDQIGVLSSRIRQAERGQGVIRLRGSGSLADERAFQQAQQEAQAARDARINELRQRPAQIEFQGRNGFRDFSSGAEERVRARARQEVIDRIDAQRRISSRSGLTGFLQDVPGIQEGLRLQQQDELINSFNLRYAQGRQRQRQSQQQAIAARQEQASRQQLLSKRVSDAGTQALIGGFFPLLFGQGPIAALGGAAGGGIGGFLGNGLGFGAALAGTTIGQGITTNLQKGTLISDALRDPIAQFQALKEAAILSSKGLEQNVSALIAQGRTAEAAARIQQDLRNNFGDAGSFRRFQQEQDSLQRSSGRLALTSSAFFGRPLASLLGRITKSVNDFGILTGAPVPNSNRTVEDIRVDRLRSFGLFGFRANTQNVEQEQRNRLEDDIAKARASTEQARFDRLQRLRGSVAFYQSRGNGLLAAQRELQAFDADRSNRLAAVSKEERPGEAAKLAQERYQLELRIAAERRAQNAAAEQSANKVLSLQEQTSILRKTPYLSERDARLLQEQAALNDAERANRAAQNAAAANRTDPALQQNAREAASALETAGQRYRNAVLEAARETRRLDLDAALQTRGLRERGRIADLSPRLSGTGVGILRSRAGLLDTADEYTRSLIRLREAPQDGDRRRAAELAAERLRTAGKEFRADLQQAFENAKTEAQSLRLRLSGAATSLAESLTSRGPGSLNSLLPQPLVAGRQVTAFQQLLPQFNAAKQYVRDSSGNQNYDVNFSGSVEAVNQRMLEYIRAALNEQSLQLDYINATRDNAKAAESLSVVMTLVNNTLPTALSEATAAITKLEQKNWNVYVNPPASPAPAPIPTAVPSTPRTPALKPLGVF